MQAASSTSGAAGAIWVLIAVLSLACAASFATTGVALPAWQFGGVALVIGALVGLSTFYTVVRTDERLARLCRAAAELFLLSFLSGSLSYTMTALNRPLWDATFLGWDEALRFDWRFWLSVLDAHPNIHRILAVAYLSMLPQLALVIVVLTTIRAYRDLDLFLLAFGGAAALTVAISALMPALSPIVHLGIVAADHPNIVLAVPLEFQHHALALRDGSMRIIDLDGAQGLVTFPSFHTVAAILLLTSFWRVPYARWFGLGLNLTMLVSIPIEGSHYLVDVLAGAAVALLSLQVARRIVLWSEMGRTRFQTAPGLA